MDVAHGEYGTSQMPLAGAVLCCTSIAPEQRAELGAIGAQMGAAIKLDLTSDVTHLIVGSINSAKYRYVAKSREDVKVLLPEWLEALRTVWMEGDDVDVAELERRYRLPTFYGLKICLTGFDNPEQRKFIQDTVMQNGAEYHGDLTKSVTHLIAATPSGKKYEHAINWRMKIVTWEWFEQSQQRGMALDESYYHPSMPVEERGKGAWDRRRSTSPALGKRTRDPDHAQAMNPLRRKLRRSASSRVGSQSQALWAGITAAGAQPKRDEEEDWTDEKVAKLGVQPPNAPTPGDTELDPDGAHAEEGPAFRGRQPFPDEDDSIFSGRLVFPHGFDQTKTVILQQHLNGNGAMVVRDPTELGTFSADERRRGFVVVPHDAPTELTSLPAEADDMCLVTNWWIERCLHGKSLVDPTSNILCRPFERLSVDGFDKLAVNITGFTGIELLHVTKVIPLMGAKYNEFLCPQTSVMVCNTRKPNPEKFKYATEKEIPAVHASWLWDSICSGKAEPYDNYLLNAVPPNPSKPRQKSQSSFKEVPTAKLSEEDSFKLRQKKAQSAKPVTKPRPGTRRPGTLELALSGSPLPTGTTASSANPTTSTNNSDIGQDAQPIGGFDGTVSLPLQDINPSVNSPRRPSSSSTGSTTHPNTKATSTRSNSLSDVAMKPVPAPRKSKLAREPSPDSVIPAVEADSVVPPDPDPSPEPKSRLPAKDYSSIMSNLLANRKALSDALPAGEATGRRKRRPLGRAQSSRSNASTTDEMFSRTGSRQEEESEILAAEEERKVVEVVQPSQELGWDSPGAQRAREKMIRAMGGEVEETANVLEGIGVVRDAVSEMGMGRATRKRRG